MSRNLILTLCLVTSGLACGGGAVDPGGGVGEAAGVRGWIAELAQPDSRRHTEALLAIEEMGEDAVPELINALGSSHPASCLHHDVLLILHDLAPAEAVPALLAVSRDRSETECNRLLALRCLWRIGEDATGAIPGLIDLIQERDEPDCIRVQAARTLERIGPDSEDLVPMLVAIARNQDTCTCLRVLCAKTLRAIGPKCRDAVPTLVSLLRDREEEKGLRITALRTIGYIGPEAVEAVPDLTRLVQDDTEERCYRILAARALGRIGPAARAAAPVLRVAAGHEDRLFRKAAKHALQRIEGADAGEEVTLGDRRGAPRGTA